MTVFRHAIHSALIIVLAFLAGDGPGSAASGLGTGACVNHTFEIGRVVNQFPFRPVHVDRQ
jgi:hypothetical protein